MHHDDIVKPSDLLDDDIWKMQEDGYYWITGDVSGYIQIFRSVKTEDVAAAVLMIPTQGSVSETTATIKFKRIYAPTEYAEVLDLMIDIGVERYRILNQTDSDLEIHVSRQVLTHEARQSVLNLLSDSADLENAGEIDWPLEDPEEE